MHIGSNSPCLSATRHVTHFLNIRWAAAPLRISLNESYTPVGGNAVMNGARCFRSERGRRQAQPKRPSVFR
jgi:hypothetical protein